MKLFRAAATAFLAFVSCGAGKSRDIVPFPSPCPIDESLTTPVILVTLDGVRWQDVFGPAGREHMPNLYRNVETEGAVLGAPDHGATISSSGPNFVSLPGYTELFEGRTHTGCLDNFCTGATEPTLVDEIRSQHINPADVAVISSWEAISFAATLQPERIVVSSGSVAAQGTVSVLLDATRDAYLAGLGVPSWPGHADYRPDRYTIPLALAYLHARHPAFLYVGLGDTDEYAHKGRYDDYLSALRSDDDFLGRLFDELRGMGERGRRTVVLITADHGRAANFKDHGGDHPESARTWLFAAGGALARGFISATAPRHLADIAPTIRVIVGLPANVHSDGHPLRELLDH